MLKITKLLLVLLTIAFTQCKKTENRQEDKQSSTEHISASIDIPAVAARPEKPYQKYCKDLKKSLSASNKKKNLFKSIHQDMPAYWSGTTWDFNGMSREPGKGEIACGYYVTTTLKDLGFPIKRIYLAQQASAIMVDKLCVDKKRLSSQKAVFNYINSQPDSSVYIVGLDYHVGYLTKVKKDEIYFIHSNFIDREGVVKELAKESSAFESNLYVIGSLSKSKALLAKWQ